MAAPLNLDAARAARREAAGEPVSFVLGGETFDLPVEMPLEALDYVAQLPTADNAAVLLAPLLRAMIGEDEWPRFMAQKPTLDDMLALSDHLWTEYGVDPSKPSQSGPPARGTGKRSKQTS